MTVVVVVGVAAVVIDGIERITVAMIERIAIVGNLVAVSDVRVAEIVGLLSLTRRLDYTLELARSTAL
jgi:hypothetical protein